MVNALLMFTAAAIGFGGSPWMGFAIAAWMLVLVGLPQQLALLKQYADEPKTDIVLGMLFASGLAVGAFVSAWFGYFLVLLLKS